MTYWYAGNRISGDRMEKGEQAGRELLSFTNVDSHVHDVTFPVPFDAPPVVLVNLASGAGETARWTVRAINVSSTTFQIFVQSGAAGANSTWADIEVQWEAKAT